MISPQSPPHAVIYARVSSAAQTKRGDGLGSQETRCREFARMKGYRVVHVYRDDMSGGLAIRPGMQSMLEFLRRNRDDNPIVIIDDVSRLARGLDAHLQLRSAISEAGGRLESPSIEFGEDSDSILVENLLASVSQHQRQKNAEQTRNRMRARALNGYWCFQAPVGYRYQQSQGHGKILVRDEPRASIIQEALEGFASGRFQSQVEVKRFLESRPDYPKDTQNGHIHNQRITDILNRPIYAGMIEVPNWQISRRQGHHESLISVRTFNRVQDRLRETSKAPARKDISGDFPLRGAVSCADCGATLTACWSTGKAKKYPYYLCHSNGCPSYRKSIPRSTIEGAFTELLKAIGPSKALHGLFVDLFTDIWSQRLGQQQAHHQALKDKAAEIDQQIASLAQRTVDASTRSVVQAYEQRITILETERLTMEEELSETANSGSPFEGMFEHALDFLSNPLKLWNSGDLGKRRTALNLTFATHLAYCRQEGFRTPEFSIPFKVLASISGPNNAMAHPGGFCSNTLFNVLANWEQQLNRRNGPDQDHHDRAA